MSCENDSQRPTIHRPHQSPLTKVSRPSGTITPTSNTAGTVTERTGTSGERPPPQADQAMHEKPHASNRLWIVIMQPRNCRQHLESPQARSHMVTPDPSLKRDKVDALRLSNGVNICQPPELQVTRPTLLHISASKP
jgi:hypothetical protein